MEVLNSREYLTQGRLRLAASEFRAVIEQQNDGELIKPIAKLVPLEWNRLYSTLFYTFPAFTSPHTPSPTVASLERVLGTSPNVTDGPILRRIRRVGVGVRLADAPVLAAPVLSVVVGVVRGPRFAVHRAVNALRVVDSTQHVDDDLVADARLARGRRVARVVARLGSAGGSARNNAVGEGLDRREAEEFVAHVGVCVGHWVVGSVDGTPEWDGALEPGLRLRRGVLVVAIATGDGDVEGV